MIAAMPHAHLDIMQEGPIQKSRALNSTRLSLHWVFRDSAALRAARPSRDYAQETHSGAFFVFVDLSASLMQAPVPSQSSVGFAIAIVDSREWNNLRSLLEE
jgi:hypothetical protein